MTHPSHYSPTSRPRVLLSSSRSYSPPTMKSSMSNRRSSPAAHPSRSSPRHHQCQSLPGGVVLNIRPNTRMTTTSTTTRTRANTRRNNNTASNAATQLYSNPTSIRHGRREYHHQRPDNILPRQSSRRRNNSTGSTDIQRRRCVEAIEYPPDDEQYHLYASSRWVQPGEEVDEYRDATSASRRSSHHSNARSGNNNANKTRNVGLVFNFFNPN